MKSPMAFSFRQLVCLMLIAMGLSSRAMAVQVTVTMDWKESFSAKDSSGSNLVSGVPTVQLGWFSSVDAASIAATVTRANLGSYFTSLASASFLGVPGTGQGNFSYTFDGDNTTVDEFDSLGNPTGNDPATKTTLYMVLTSGTGDLGIYKWIRNGDDLWIPRDPATYTADRSALATQVGVTNAANMVAVVGSVATNGLTLANTGGSAPAAPTLRLLAVGTPVYANGDTTVTHTFSGNSNATYIFEYKASLAGAWQTNTVSVASGSTFSVTFTNGGVNSTNEWKNRMFFRVKNG